MVYLGIDFGTSGARAIAIDGHKQPVDQVKIQFPSTAEAWVKLWPETLWQLLSQLAPSTRRHLRSLVINGTSSTVLLCDLQGNPLAEPLLYNDDRGWQCREQLRAIAPATSLVHSATSSLAKLLWYREQPYFSQGRFFLHQADWLGFLLHGQLGISDYHNALKLGYDGARLAYPSWLKQQAFFPLLPRIVAPGQAIAPILPPLARRFRIAPQCVVASGTTDSLAAFFASDRWTPGTAVTSLGSTLVIKLLSDHPVFDQGSGIYSHRWQNFWLVGGASNTGGAVLKQLFGDRLETLSQAIDLRRSAPGDYYPLLKPGERFPINDPQLLPRLQPRPDNEAEFLHGVLTAMAKIEALGYEKLQALGATPVRQILTAGGGAHNLPWQTIRAQYLPAPVAIAPGVEAALGSALLAWRGDQSSLGHGGHLPMKNPPAIGDEGDGKKTEMDR